jgi:hypothetical protein
MVFLGMNNFFYYVKYNFVISGCFADAGYFPKCYKHSFSCKIISSMRTKSNSKYFGII